MAAYLKKPFCHNPLIARKLPIRVMDLSDRLEQLHRERAAEVEQLRAELARPWWRRLWWKR